MTLHTVHNKEEAKILRTTCVPFDFSRYTKKEIRDLIKEMRIKMKEWLGVGLASTQIGRTEAFFVAQTPEGKFHAIFNPKITSKSGPLTLEEACLSVPGRYGEITRYDAVTLEGQDHNGKPIKIKAQGLLAQIFQHETDHLAGKLYIDKADKTYTSPTSARLREKETD